MDPKILTENGWKAVAQKSKIKDNGLQRALAAYERIDDDEHEDRLKAIATVNQLAGSLGRSKEVAAVPAVVNYLDDLLSAAESAGFRRRWRELQGEFVDDPQRAVRGAGDLSREILQALADTIADAERIDRWKAEDGTSGTEDLRVALRQYRTLVDRLLEL